MVCQAFRRVCGGYVNFILKGKNSEEGNLGLELIGSG